MISLNLENELQSLPRSRGIGRAAVDCLCQARLRRRSELLKDKKAADAAVGFAEEQGVQALAVKADMSYKGDAQRLIDATIHKFGRLDFLVCNAGIWEGSAIDQMSEEVWNRTIDLNLKGTWAGRAAVPPKRKKVRRSDRSRRRPRGEATSRTTAASKVDRYRSESLAPIGHSEQCNASRRLVDTDMADALRDRCRQGA